MPPVPFAGGNKWCFPFTRAAAPLKGGISAHRIPVKPEALKALWDSRDLSAKPPEPRTSHDPQKGRAPLGVRQPLNAPLGKGSCADPLRLSPFGRAPPGPEGRPRKGHATAIVMSTPAN